MVERRQFSLTAASSRGATGDADRVLRGADLQDESGKWAGHNPADQTIAKWPSSSDNFVQKCVLGHCHDYVAHTWPTGMPQAGNTTLRFSFASSSLN